MKRKSRLTIALLLGVLALSGCEKKAPNPVGITIKAEGDKQSIKVGETLKFSALVMPEGAVQKVKWTVAPVTGEANITDEGVLTAVKEGNVNVVATSYVDEAIKATAALTIEKALAEVKLTSLEIVTTKTELNVNETVQLAVRATPENASNDVTWSVDNAEVATVNVAGGLKGLKAGTVKVTATSKVDATIKAEKQFTVKAGETPAPEPSTDWETIKLSTIDEYLAAKSKDAVKVRGTCTAIVSQNEETISYYLSNGKAGVFVYMQPVALGIPAVGSTYEVCGKKAIANNAHELSSLETLTKVDEKVEYVDTDLADLNFSDNAAMASYQGGIVHLNDAEIAELPTKYTKAYSVDFTFGGKTSSLRIDPKNMSKEDFTAFETMFKAASVGQKFSFKGYMNCFGYGKGGNPQIKILKPSDVTVKELTDQEKVDTFIKSLEIKTTYTAEDKKATLPTTLESIPGSTITWESNSAVIKNDGTITHGDDMVDVTLTATLQVNGAKATKTFVVTAFPKDDSKLEVVSTLDFEDCTLNEDNGYGVSVEKPSYSGNDLLSLGNPKTQWHFNNCLIGGSDSDHKNGSFAARMKPGKTEAEQAKSGLLRLEQDYTFSIVEFKLATYGGHAFGSHVYVSYSTDSGTTWKNIENKDAVSIDYKLQTFRYEIPGANDKTRVAINYKAGSSSATINVDDIRLLKVK